MRSTLRGKRFWDAAPFLMVALSVALTSCRQTGGRGAAQPPRQQPQAVNASPPDAPREEPRPAPADSLPRAAETPEPKAAAPVPAAPAPTPAAEQAGLTLPTGTRIDIELKTRLGTKASRAGDRFEATVVSPVRAGGSTAIPAGALITGRVVVSEQPGKASGRGHLQLAYDKLSFGGRSYDLASRSRVYESRSGAKKDRELIGGGAAAGGVIGGVLGRSAGSAVKGVLIGGAAGTGAALLSRGPQLEFPPGTKLHFRLDRSLTIDATPAS